MTEAFPNLENVFQVHFVEGSDFLQVSICPILGRECQLPIVKEE